ncbi:putative hydrolase [Mycena venus]|uniref:Putative hydrolase n=1 Tax=Mycena venus TaxID=2733690 RepID=A0A8H6XJF6_9AGAR|nr:putative hydrolase [Mycena venus]
MFNWVRPDGTQLRCDITPMDAYAAQARVGTWCGQWRGKSAATALQNPYGRMFIDLMCSNLSVGTTAGGHSPANIVLTQKHRLLHLRLSPLREVGDDLRCRLGTADPEFTFANSPNGVLSGVLDEYSPTHKSFSPYVFAQLPLRHGLHHKQDVHPIRQQSGTITAQELERALINGDWTLFDLDKVKLLTTIFDTDRSGTIGFNEFASLWKYIKDWQNIFNLTATAPTLPGPASQPVKLVIVIGKPVKDVSKVDALDYVLGCTAANDVSFCKHQMAVLQWTFSKAFDNTSPLGPCLVSGAAIPDPHKIPLKCL